MLPDLLAAKRSAAEWLAIAQEKYDDCLAAAGMVQGARYDPEAAHGDEDDLRTIALHAIASGDVAGEDAIRLAKLALSTESLDFPRWCA